MPKIVAKIQTGGDRIDVNRAIAPPTAAEQAAIQACLAKHGVRVTPGAGPPRGGAGGGGGLGGGRRSRPGRRQPRRLRASACPRACSASARRSRPRARRCSRCSTRRRRHRRASRTRSAASSSATRRSGLVTAAQVTNGRFLRGGREALVSATYAARRVAEGRLEAEPERDAFTVVGLVDPPLGGQGVDVYLPLAQLQKLSGQTGPRQRRARARRRQLVGRARSSSEIEPTVPAGRRWRARSRSPTRSAARSSTRPTSRTASALALSIVAAAAAFLARRAAGALVRRQARPRARHAEGARLDAAARRPPGRRRVARPGRARRASLGVALGVAVALAVGASRPDADRQLDRPAAAASSASSEVARTTSNDVSLTAPIGVHDPARRLRHRARSAACSRAPPARSGRPASGRPTP